jgi:hypothetical protein
MWYLFNCTCLSRTFICSPHSKYFCHFFSLTCIFQLCPSLRPPPKAHSIALLFLYVHYPNRFRTTLKKGKAISSVTLVHIKYTTRCHKDKDWISETWGRCAWLCVADGLGTSTTPRFYGQIFTGSQIWNHGLTVSFRSCSLAQRRGIKNTLWIIRFYTDATFPLAYIHNDAANQPPTYKHPSVDL